MAVSVKHETVATAPNDDTKEVSSDAWNAGHAVSGLGDSAEKDVGTGADQVAAGDHLHTGVYDPAGSAATAQAAAEATAAAALAAHEGAANPHPTYLTAAEGDAAYAALSHGTHVPNGGTTGQVLKKASDTDGALEWGDDETSAGGAAAWGDITGTLADQTDLQDELDAKAPLASPTFTGTVAGITKSMVGLGNVDNTADSAKPVSTAQQTALDAKQPLDTDLTALAGISGADGDIIIRTGGAWTKLAKGTDGHVLTLASGVPSWAAAGGGSDPWTYQVLTNDFTTSSTTVADVTQGELLGFAPAANTKYLFEGQLMLRTATTTVNPRLGFAWATGLTDGVVQIEESQSATAQLQAHGNINAAVLIAVGGLPSTTQSWPAYIWGTVVAGATPSGNCRVQLSTETAGTIVRVVAGSWFRFRSYT